MIRGTQSGTKQVGPASKRQGPLFGRNPKESSRVLCGKFVMGGTGKAEGRRAAGRWYDPERVPESAENTYCWSEHRRTSNLR